MWAAAEVLQHPYEATADCGGGDECEHREKVFWGFGFAGNSLSDIDYEQPYEEQVLQTVRNLFASDKRLRDGHFFTITIN